VVVEGRRQEGPVAVAFDEDEVEGFRVVLDQPADVWRLESDVTDLRHGYRRRCLFCHVFLLPMGWQ
jgi:hypothetical protein